MSFRTPNFPDLEGLGSYIASISSGFCPYISPSTNVNAIHNTVYMLDENQGLEASIFYLGLLHTEILRDSRVKSSPGVAVLSCDNLIFRFASEKAVDGKALFAWPHWLLKTHYTEVGVLFGKFWLGEQENSRLGEPIPPPPYHVLSIRSTIIKRDPAFFQKAPGLLGDLLESDDDGRNVVDALSILSDRPSSEWGLNEVFSAFSTLQSSGMYEMMKDEAHKKMEAK